jgi:hypothetical protein
LGRKARWGLPWLCILAISVSAADSMTVGLAHGLPAGDTPLSLAVREVPAGGLATGEPAEAGNSPRDDACATRGPMVYVGLGTWIHDPNVPCRDDAP